MACNHQQDGWQEVDPPCVHPMCALRNDPADYEYVSGFTQKRADEMSDYYNLESTRAGEPHWTIVREQFCAAQSLRGSSWYRVVVIDILDLHTLLVHYIDLALTAQVPAAIVRPLRSAWCDLPEDQVRACLGYDNDSASDDENKFKESCTPINNEKPIQLHVFTMNQCPDLVEAAIKELEDKGMTSVPPRPRRTA
ncbi:uncharacterized protein LOC142986234 [Anticarsia gemmatalis]|uniref:uncharacterized protein LOC142986234 n=1 Tax=Anticarsia gemmatalis TaxID=129554 RepID=UPI003F77515C